MRKDERNNFCPRSAYGHNPKFHCADGQITRYGLACGYIQVWYVGNTKIVLWQEHNVYHVSHGYNNFRGEWGTYNNLTAARACFRHKVKEARKEQLNESPS